MIAGLLATLAATSGILPVALAPDCRAAQLSLALDATTPGGADLIVRNAGPPCRLPGLPAVRFADAAGSTLPITRQTPPGMHPGPVVVPVELATGGAASAALRWASGDADGAGQCASPAAIRVEIGTGAALTSRFAGRLCGSPVTFQQSWFKAVP